MALVEIYGCNCEIPDFTGDTIIEDWGTDNPSEQYWRRKDIPYFFTKVEYDKDGNALLNEQQRKYALEEVRRCKEGFWFYNNGFETYITGKHYFYLQWWKLEDDIYPDYRNADRKYYIFLNHWENTLWCLGVLRGKKRREGASSQATANIVYECIFYKNSNCGLTSKTQVDAKNAFTNMVSFGYRQLPVFLKPQQLNNKDSVTELVFAHKSVTIKGSTGSVIDNDTGHRSRVDYRAPTLNAYDSGRLSRALFDEGGKWAKETPFSQFLSIVSKTMVKGAKRVGFAECPSTVNELTKSGGAEFKIVWDNANQFKSNFQRTQNQFVRYFSPAYDGYEGFIDKHGMSVIDEPTHEQYQYLVDKWVGKSSLTEEDIKLGAKAFLLKKREGLTGMQYEEEVRQNPFDEDEMFLYAGQGCEFNALNLKKQIKQLEDEPVYLRKIRLNLINKKSQPYHLEEKQELYVEYMDDENGGWLLLEKPIFQNGFKRSGEYIEPLNKHIYQIGVDTTKNEFAINGSKPTIVVFKQSFIHEGEETGMYPVAMYIDKTRLDVHFDQEVLKACMWYGCTANYEIDARTDFYRYFWSKGADRMLEWTPKIAQNPIKNKALTPGTQSADPFQLQAQLQVAKMYVDGTDPDNYNGHVHRIKFPELLKQLLSYDHSNRTKSDQVIALMMSLLPVMGRATLPNRSTHTKPKSILPLYDIKEYA